MHLSSNSFLHFTKLSFYQKLEKNLILHREFEKPCSGECEAPEQVPSGEGADEKALSLDFHFQRKKGKGLKPLNNDTAEQRKSPTFQESTFTHRPMASRVG